MRVLGIDTSAGASVALVEDTKVLGAAQLDDPRAHAEQLAVTVQKALCAAGYETAAEAGVELVAVGTGPAPFTGLRAGLVSARVLAHVLGVPVAGVCSLDALARAALDLVAGDCEVLAVTDAKRHEVYCARYVAAGPNDVECLHGPVVDSPHQAANVPASVTVVGAGALLYPEEFEVATGMPSAVDAAVIARLAAARQARGLDQSTEPLYLRRPDIHRASGKKSTLG